MATFAGSDEMETLAAEKAALQEQSEVRTRELETLLRVSRAVASTLDLDQVMHLILEQLGQVVDYDCASLILLEGDGLVLQDIVVSTNAKFGQENRVRFKPDEDLDVWSASDARPKLDTPCILVAASREFWQMMRAGDAYLVEDVMAVDDERTLGYRRLMAARTDTPEFMRSWLAVPLMARDRVIGYIGASSAKSRLFSDRHAQLARAFADQAAIAVENARLFSESRETAVMEERHRVARDLHDSVAQALYGVGLGAKAARRYLDTQPESAIEPVDYVISLAEAGLAEMRALIFDLYPESLQREGLAKAISGQLTALPSRYGIEVEWTCPAEPDASPQVKETAYAIVREAVHNAVKHSQTAKLTVILDASDGLRFTVRDYGIGFSEGELPAGHMGLKSMRERIAQFGGELQIESQAGGTTVRGLLPLST